MNQVLDEIHRAARELHPEAWESRDRAEESRVTVAREQVVAARKVDPEQQVEDSEFRGQDHQHRAKDLEHLEWAKEFHLEASCSLSIRYRLMRTITGEGHRIASVIFAALLKSQSFRESAHLLLPFLSVAPVGPQSDPY